MARIRTVKPEFFTSEDVCSLPPIARLFFVACWCEADREGRLEWKPRTMKLRYFPADGDDIEAVAAKVVKQGLVRLYEVDGKALAVIPSFLRHQHINPREAASTIPAPPPMDDTVATREHASARVDDASARVTDAQGGKERKVREGESPPSPLPTRNDGDDGDWVSHLSDHDRALVLVWRATGSHDDQIRTWLTTTRGPHRERIAAWMRDGIPADRLPGIIIDILDRLEASDGTLRAGGKPINDLWAYLGKAVPSAWARIKAGEASADEHVEGGSPPEPWPQRLAGFRTKSIWLPSWGPAPGEPGCRVPADILNAN